MPRERLKVELRSAELLSPSVRRLVFVADRPFDYISGQWVNLFVPVPGELVHKRSYSIASAPDATEPSRLEFAVTLVEGGPVSNALFALEPGATVEMEGPFGFFTRKDAPEDRPAIFVGTGTGVTPLRAMLQAELAARADGPELVLLFGCRTPADVIFRDEFEALAHRHSRFRYEVTLSRGPEDWEGRRGYVQTHLEELVRPLLPAEVYVCGLNRMVKEVRTVLKESLGLDRKQIHTERYD